MAGSLSVKCPPPNKPLNRTLNSAVQMISVPSGINLLWFGEVRRRYSTPLNAGPLGGK